MRNATSIEDAVRQVEQHRADWLEDILAGLLSAGVQKEEIQIINSQDTRTTWVQVHGETRYEHIIEIKENTVHLTAT